MTSEVKKELIGILQKLVKEHQDARDKLSLYIEELIRQA